MDLGRILASLVAALLAIVLTAACVLRMQRRRRLLSDLTRGIEAMTSGRTPRPVRTSVEGKLGVLARSFNEFAPRLETRLTTLEGDRQLLGAVLGGMAEGVIAVDGRRRLLFANEAAGRLFGIGPVSVGKLVAELIRSPQVQEAVDSTLAGPRSHHAEILVTIPEARPLGGARTLAVHGTPLPGSPPPGAVMVFHDVTELRRLERMRQDFVANASHELKTPLAAIKAYTETLMNGALYDEEVNGRFLGQIDEQADRLNRLIMDLLSLARLEAGQDVFQHGPLPLVPILRACADSHRGRAEAKDLAYGLRFGSPEDELWVRADDEAIRQILDNLIDNAIKYTPDGGSVQVSCRMVAEKILIDVSDSGIGIPREDLPRVFERFYRVDKARSRELGGTGLGLSIVKHLVQSLFGAIVVESRVGQGTVFTVSLPRLRRDPADDDEA